MTAPKLTALGRVLEVGDGRVVVESDFGRASVAAKRDAARAYAALLYQPGAVRVTVEAVDAGGASPLRSAEEIAREIVPEPVVGGDGWTNYITRGDHCIEQLGWSERHMADEDRDSLRSVFVDVINEARADGATAALAAQQPRDLAGEAAADRILAGYRAVTEALDHLRSVVAAGPMSPVNQARAALYVADEVLGGAVVAQPSDLAGRIRALVQEYAGRWADACVRAATGDGEDSRREVAMRKVLDDLAKVYERAACGDQHPDAAAFIRKADVLMGKESRAVRNEAADDLERILREHEAQR